MKICHLLYSLSKILKIKQRSFFKSLSHLKVYNIDMKFFFKRKTLSLLNDSKATSFQATKFALESAKNIFWIVGGFKKKNDKFYFKNIQKNIIKSYIIGKNIVFFKKQLQKKS